MIDWKKGKWFDDAVKGGEKKSKKIMKKYLKTGEKQKKEKEKEIQRV